MTEDDKLRPFAWTAGGRELLAFQAKPAQLVTLTLDGKRARTIDLGFEGLGRISDATLLDGTHFVFELDQRTSDVWLMSATP